MTGNGLRAWLKITNCVDWGEWRIKWRENHANENALGWAVRFYHVNAQRTSLWKETHSAMKDIPVLYNCPLFVLTNCDQKTHCILLSELREPRQTSSANSGYQIHLSTENAVVIESSYLLTMLLLRNEIWISLPKQTENKIKSISLVGSPTKKKKPARSPLAANVTIANFSNK